MASDRNAAYSSRAVARGVTECAFCGSEVGEAQARMMLEFHETFTLLVLADPGTPEYEAHLAEARRILDVQ